MPEQSSPYSFQNMMTMLNQNFGGIVIVLVLVVGAFVMGSIWTENKILRSREGGSGSAAAAAQQVAQAAQGAAAPNAPTAPTTATVDVGNLPLKGDKNAKITIVE